MSTGAAAAVAAPAGGANGGSGSSGGAAAGASGSAAPGFTGGTGTGTGNPVAGSSGQQPGLATANPNTSAPDWTSGFNDDHKGYVGNKGWKQPAELVDSYRNLEKLLGAPQEEIFRIPKSDDQGGWEQAYTKLGRPKTPEDYKLEVPKEGGNPEFAKWAASEFHKNGLSERQAKGIVESWNKHMGDSTAATKEAAKAKLAESQGALKKEWGAAYDQNLNIARNAAKQFGVPPEVVDALEVSSNYQTTMKFFHSIGKGLGEANFVTGNRVGGGNAIPTPGEAKAQRQALMNDHGFVKKYLAGDQESLSKMRYLDKVIVGEL